MMKTATGIAIVVLMIGLAACQQADEGGSDTASGGWAAGESGTAATTGTAGTTAAATGGAGGVAMGGTQATGGGGSSAAAVPAWGNAPDFSYRTFDGRTGKLSDFRGKPVVVNFWAAWCPPCKQEMPDFNEVYQARDGAFELIAVAVDNRSDPAAYFAAQDFSYTGGMDVDGAARYVGAAIPVTVFIDRQGNLVHKQEGMMSREQFEGNLARIL